MELKDVRPSDIRQERIQQVASMPTDALAHHLRTTWAEAELIQRSIALYPELVQALADLLPIVENVCTTGRDNEETYQRAIACDQARAVIARCQGGAS